MIRVTLNPNQHELQGKLRMRFLRFLRHHRANPAHMLAALAEARALSKRTRIGTTPPLPIGVRVCGGGAIAPEEFMRRVQWRLRSYKRPPRRLPALDTGYFYLRAILAEHPELSRGLYNQPNWLAPSDDEIVFEVNR